MRIVLIGRNDQVGSELECSLAPIGEIVAFDRQALDLEDPGQITARLRDAKSDVIVNAAAYTVVDAAEKDADVAMAINGEAPGILGEEARRLGSLLIHYSTDYVFDGTKGVRYTEQDIPNPISVYGKSMIAGERAIQASGCRHVVLRTAWVYSAHGSNFLLTILRVAKEKPELRVVDDQHGAPTWARDIAEASVKILKHRARPDGIYHLTAGGGTTWHGFAQAIADRLGLDTRVMPIKTTEFPAAAPRPANSLLSNEKLYETFDISLRDWSAALKECLTTLAGDTAYGG